MADPVAATPGLRARALGLYRAGATSREIAAQLGAHPRTVERWIAQVEQLRRRGPRGRTDVPTELIRELRDTDGLSWAEIAREVGMSKTGVQHRYRVATTGRNRHSDGGGSG